uniref:hypothetical protein n=1 Tax=Shewanella algae TaxID=38313 RepID=UPI0031F5B7A2
ITVAETCGNFLARYGILWKPFRLFPATDTASRKCSSIRISYLDAEGEVSIPSMYVDASGLGDFTAKGYALSQLCAPKANLDKIKVTVSYQPPIGPNGELTFCLSNQEFMLSELSDL